MAEEIKVKDDCMCIECFNQPSVQKGITLECIFIE